MSAIRLEDLQPFAAEMRRCAKRGVFDGRETPSALAYLHDCRRIHQETQTVLIYTRDTGHHTSGWFKNPDYERCLHLSLSPAPRLVIVPGLERAELDKEITSLWVRAFFGDHARLAWAESPKTPQGKSRGVWHWRVFCDEHWQSIQPRGEVYSREFTEAGWLSASELGVAIESVVDPS